MKIYIAGPYTSGDTAKNVRIAIYEGDYVSRLGHIPFIPHLTHFWHFLIPHDYEFWMYQDEQWLLSCDAILRLKGESAGADREVAKAIELGLPVYNSVFDVPKVAQVRPTLLTARPKSVTCPQCGCVHGVDLPASQSG